MHQCSIWTWLANNKWTNSSVLKLSWKKIWLEIDFFELVPLSWSCHSLSFFFSWFLDYCTCHDSLFSLSSSRRASSLILQTLIYSLKIALPSFEKLSSTFSFTSSSIGNSIIKKKQIQFSIVNTHHPPSHSQPCGNRFSLFILYHDHSRIFKHNLGRTYLSAIWNRVDNSSL